MATQLTQDAENKMTAMGGQLAGQLMTKGEFFAAGQVVNLQNTLKEKLSPEAKEKLYTEINKNPDAVAALAKERILANPKLLSEISANPDKLVELMGIKDAPVATAAAAPATPAAAPVTQAAPQEPKAAAPAAAESPATPKAETLNTAALAKLLQDPHTGSLLKKAEKNENLRTVIKDIAGVDITKPEELSAAETSPEKTASANKFLSMYEKNPKMIEKLDKFVDTDAGRSMLSLAAGTPGLGRKMLEQHSEAESKISDFMSSFSRLGSMFQDGDFLKGIGSMFAGGPLAPLGAVLQNFLPQIGQFFDKITGSATGLASSVGMDILSNDNGAMAKKALAATNSPATETVYKPDGQPQPEEQPVLGPQAAPNNKLMDILAPPTPT